MLKILPIAAPEITTYQFYAIPLSIILTCEKNLNYIYNEFIQIHCLKYDYKCRKGDFDTNLSLNFYIKGTLYEDINYYPLDRISLASTEQLFLFENFDIIKYCIDNEYYIYTYLDKYYIQDTYFNDNLHFNHDVLITGYNDQNKDLYIYTYYKNKLENRSVKYSDFMNAYKSSIYHDKFYHDRAVLYKLSNRYIEPDIEKMKWYLLDYIDSSDTFSRIVTKFYYRDLCYAWGIDVYEELIKLFYIIIEKNIPIYINDIHAFCSHKEIMYKRFVYLKINNIAKISEDLINIFKNILNEAEMLVFMSLKVNEFINNINLSEANICIEKMINILKQMKETEIQAIYSLLHQNNLLLERGIINGNKFISI